jgi:hypothetical protein
MNTTLWTTAASKAALLASLALSLVGRADYSVTIEWDPNPEPDVVSYKVYHGTDSRAYGFTNEVANSTQCVISNLQIEATYYFAVTAINLSGLESDFSEELRYSAIEEGIEADVSPRPEGSRTGTVTVTDWVQVGRFVAGLDPVAAAAEFRRVDCAPRVSGGNVVGGNGQITVTDWVQAGRYAAGLDPITPVSGPSASDTGLLGSTSAVPSLSRQSAGAERFLRIDPLSGATRGAMAVTVSLRAVGNENAVGFSLNFEASTLRLRTVEAGQALGSGAFVVNDTEAAQGRVGVVAALPTQQSLARGEHVVATLHFMILGETSPVAPEFATGPVAIEVANVEAESLPLTLVKTAVRDLTDEVAAGVSPLRIVSSDDGLALSWPLELRGARLEFTDDLASGNWQPVELEPIVSGDDQMVRLAVSGEGMRFFRLRADAPTSAEWEN